MNDYDGINLPVNGKLGKPRNSIFKETPHRFGWRDVQLHGEIKADETLGRPHRPALRIGIAGVGFAGVPDCLRQLGQK
ncbi:MAG TPA: hypothetical protein VNN22_04365 [Verrucomicrobiae bacterium]|nr:hypothetical protein [Verrucomicrobiae bacterium]